MVIHDNLGPKLRALLDQRDHLLIQISMEDEPGFSGDISDMRRRVIDLDRSIRHHWQTPTA